MSDLPDYKDTVFLPKTDFPMKAGLPQKEPGILAKWEAEGLYAKLREARAGREKFIFHDGPPYANGAIHIGHALNHTIKDMVCRTQTMLGKDAPYVPGWDCHGLPIEWKVEEQYRKARKSKDDVPLLEFRAECRAYAQHWVDVQREQLKRLGVLADWDNPYLTMQPESEATIVAELLKFAESGQLYRGAKPVMWSPVEKTALAEAEVEYEEITSTQIDVAFEIVESPIAELVGAHAVIWTTTPWTIPVNQALAYGPEIEYVLLSVTADTPGTGGKGDKRVNEVLAAAGLPFHTNRISKFLVAKELATSFADRLNKVAKALDYGDASAPSLQEYIDPYSDRDASISGSDLAGTVARHPMHHLGGFFAAPRPFLPGEFVTTDSGTGLVHMAPDHGEDDFDLCKAHGLNPKFAVEADGKYREDWPWLGGQGSVINPKFNAPDGPICADLRESGGLLAASADYKHSYPHSWRSKAKVIYRCTPQWFVPMDKIIDRTVPRCADEAAIRAAQGDGETLREVAMREIERVRFTPEKGRNRIGSMVSGRPDWVLSRQRAWGVPITLFVGRKSGEYLVDAEVNAAIVAAVREQGIDAWTPETAHRFLTDRYDPAEWEAVPDILDVWFDSGTSHAYVLDSGRWPELSWPADIYVEGSDQHRGWFQSSLLESCATRGRAPYDAILTHGFTMDAKGLKMSKSLGNTVDPNTVMETYGADIIRLWALSVDFTEDHRIGDEILKGVADQYRKLRNTFRYLLGALDGFDYDTESVGFEAMPELERYVLARLNLLYAEITRAIETYDFNEYVRALVDFCNEDLSAFYFDIRKDRLYCDDPAGTERRATRTVMDILFQALVRFAAPVLVFTAEEVWTTRFPDRGSIHLQEFHPLPAEWSDPALVERFAQLRTLRTAVTEAIEPLRREKAVRSGLEAQVVVPAEAVPEGFSDAALAELFITASVTRAQGADVTVTRTEDAKCGRCWRLLPDVPEDGALCGRCAEVVA
ncbi:isoleucine--tRNA ligase [Parablastomonas sp. CN1-191]|uniref:isoleucine--tRNA ligase n=1 Tax=Parablastomonas sp. CN1-191 TaxID=3400908 RepID=UPI003BF8B4FB